MSIKDKSSTYVILNKTDYLEKCNDILKDTSKFQQIKKDPTNEIKKKANILIDAVNAKCDDIKFSKIIGDYAPGYFYGNIKTHKTNLPIRPIISQIPTPTYNMAKLLNKIINPYCPNTFSIKSTEEFVDILHSTNAKGIISSIDAESLFTNVPINQTLEIIIEYCYNHKKNKTTKDTKTHSKRNA